MDEEDEIKSERSGSRPPSPSPPPSDNGHASVTVASVHPPAEGSLTLALPIQQPRTVAGREDCWSEGATGVLIGAWGERYIELSRGNLKQKHWKEVAEIVSARENYSKPPKTDIQCKNRIDTVKKKYKLEKAKVAAGGRPSKWAFFETMNRLIGPVQAQKSIPSRPASGPEIKGNPNPRREKPPHPIRRIPSLESDSNGESSDESLSLPAAPQKKARTQAAEPMRGKSNGWAELSRAILRFGETYEKAEMEKMREAIEMEKRWMKFGKEMEVQKMELMMKTQVEISKMKNGRSQSQRRKGGGGSSKPQ